VVAVDAPIGSAADAGAEVLGTAAACAVVAVEYVAAGVGVYDASAVLSGVVAGVIVAAYGGVVANRAARFP
jgi:hypothetical protein